MKLLKFLFLSLFLVSKFTDCLAQNQELIQIIKLRDSLEQSFEYKKGAQILPCQLAKLFVPPGFKMLGVAQSKMALERIIKSAVPANLQGTMYPENGNPYDTRNERYIISFQNTGHVFDDESNSLDTMFHPSQSSDTNWLSYKIKPTYEPNLHVLYFARNYRIKADSFERFELNFVFLGRNSIVKLVTYCMNYDETMVLANIPAVINSIAFNESNSYIDFVESDPVASFGLNQLIPNAKPTLIASSFLSKNWLYLIIGFILLILSTVIVIKFLHKRKL